jgi:hypothetical protein
MRSAVLMDFGEKPRFEDYEMGSEQQSYVRSTCCRAGVLLGSRRIDVGQYCFATFCAKCREAGPYEEGEADDA